MTIFPSPRAPGVALRKNDPSSNEMTARAKGLFVSITDPFGAVSLCKQAPPKKRTAKRANLPIKYKG
jgi:hypothetical protein